MENQRDQTYCKHILEAIAEIETFVQAMTFEKFSNDIKTQRAVTRDLEIIGEAAKRLSEGFKDKHATTPWRFISGMRDFLIHDYAKIEMQEVWKAAIQDVQELKKALENN